MFGRTGRSLISPLRSKHHSFACWLTDSLELIVEWHGIALTKRIDRRTDPAECETSCAGNELPGRKRFPQTGGDDADRDKDNAGDDHSRRPKESYRTQAVN